MKKGIKKILLLISQHYRLDPRALALMRIGLALVILADLLIRGSDLEAHYTDTGIWPSSLLHTFGWKTGFWSLHALSGTYSWQLFLFIIHGLLALCLLLGYKTRWSTLFLWLFTISLHNRNLFILQSGDDLLRLVLLWGLFLPWQACYSIDARRGVPVKQNILAGIGYLMLIASVYFFTVSFKRSEEWHGEGSAIYYALSLGQIRLPAGDWLYQFPNLMKALTWFVFYTEQLIPILILWPWRKGHLRLAAFVLLFILHLGIGLTLYVGLFYIINLVSALGLLPGFVLDKIENVLRLSKTPLHWYKGRRFPRYLINSACILIITLSLILNLSSVNWFPYQLQSEMSVAVNVLRLNQYWGMFSPGVLKLDGWFVYHGADSLGRQWDLRLNQDYVDYTPPQHIVSMYKSDRWRKLAENMQNNNYTFLRPLYGKYILHTWNKQHPQKKLASLYLYYMQKETLPDYKTTPIEKKLFCVCIDD